MEEERTYGERAWDLCIKLTLASVVLLPSFALLMYLFGENERFVFVMGKVFILLWLVAAFFIFKGIYLMLRSWFE